MATLIDMRTNSHKPIWRMSITQQSWATGAGNAEKTESLGINGIVKMICIRISAVTADPTVTITLKDEKSNEIYNTGAIADGTNYVYTLAEFLPTANEFPVVAPITVGITPSADAGGGTLTVDMDIYGT